MKPAMYIFVNRGLNMSPGKIAAQACHAAVEAYRLSTNSAGRDHGVKEHNLKNSLVQEWYKGGHYTKLIMLAEDEDHIRNIKHYLDERGFETVLIVDEGRTEIRPHSATALGVEVVDRDDEHTSATFESFQTYKPLKPPQKKGLLTKLH